ncbi:MAG: winged helix-turn-helix domain-containing protein [Gammaproteobacteria bacterium]|jgi:DNA-binding winged helix-turn-helix (wHTH) protein/TolB-like protein/tetratricopeptide (TPR) repeat protein|nr:winged helix-turn-helix domain-containing protein [Gammaproteobacteria bacterium]
MELDVALRKGFRLGDWEIRPIEGLVTGPQGARHLQPKTIDVLVCLAASNGQVVTRDELIARVWGGNAVADEPLTRCIHEIRRGLNDQREQPTYIQTIPKRGYRLLVPVEELDATRNPATIPPEPPVNLFWQVTRQRVLWVGAVYAVLAWVFVQLARYAEEIASVDQLPPAWLMPALVITLLLGFPVAVFFAWVKQLKFDADGPVGRSIPGMFSLLWSRRGVDLVLVTLVISVLAGMAFDIVPPSVGRANGFATYSIAVVPFDSGQEPAEDNWLGEGFADDLRSRLDSYEYLDVSSRTASFRDSLQQLDAQQIGKELGVQYLLQGWVIGTLDGPGFGDHNTIRVNARLLDTVTGFEIWSESFNRDASRLFDLQQEISRRVVVSLGLSDSPRQASDAMGNPRIDVAAYDSYLRGLNQLRKADSVARASLAAQFFRHALAADARMPMARNGLCRAYVRELELGGSDQVYGAANSACAEALLQSPVSPASHLALGDFYFVTGHPKQAVKEYEWVTDKSPDNVDAWLGMARVFESLALPVDAERAYQTGLGVQPDNTDIQEAYVAFLLAEGHYADAVNVARKLVMLDRERVQAYDYLATALFMTGKFEASIQASRQVISRDPTRAIAVKNIAQSYYYLERFDRAVAIYRQAARFLPDDHYVMGLLATAYAQLDGDESTTEALKAFLRARRLAERELQSNPDEAVTIVNLAYYCAALDDKFCAGRYLADALQMAPDDVRVHYGAALVHMQMGDTAAASAATARALRMGYPQVLILTDPLLATVWSERRFVTARLSELFTVQ